MKHTFPIVPATNGPLWLLGIVIVFMLGLVCLFGYLAYSSRNARVEVSSDGLRISGALYGRTIPAASLILEDAKWVDLSRDRDYQTKWRTNGAGLPGYHTGWFKLRNGEKALVFLTDLKRVVYVRTRDGYSVLLSVPEPEEFIQVLKGALVGVQG